MKEGDMAEVVSGMLEGHFGEIKNIYSYGGFVFVDIGDVFEIPIEHVEVKDCKS